ncbi:hypothetical protein DPMN_101695 [Dreissena polymorpha]|uniref:Uncharacterized protein n=1 Tax=Dreissena polymorpha TaxID=45954 RepID=A0A9D4R8J5_DREPO|nr:hypothetical protein DPMN_101695 [Dreissena polymorpha]
MARQRPSRRPRVGNFGWVLPMWAGYPRVELAINRIVIRIVQYQLEVNRCRNGEIIVKGNFAGRPRIDRIVIREVQYQLEVNRCRNEEVIVKGNFGWVWPMWIDRIVIREVQYQFEVNRCRNEEVNFQCSSAYSVGGASGQGAQTDGQTDGRRR